MDRGGVWTMHPGAAAVTMRIDVLVLPSVRACTSSIAGGTFQPSRRTACSLAAS
jgi:hypothetical protein